MKQNTILLALSKNIVTLRKSRSWTQKTLAQQAEISLRTVTYLERPTSAPDWTPTLEVIDKVAHALKTTIAALCFDPDGPMNLFIPSGDVQTFETTEAACESTQYRGVTAVSEPWLAVTGRTLEQELRFGFTKKIHPDDVSKAIKMVRDLNPKVVSSFKARVKMKSKKYEEIAVVSHPTYQGGKVVGRVSTFYIADGMQPIVG